MEVEEGDVPGVGEDGVDVTGDGLPGYPLYIPGGFQEAGGVEFQHRFRGGPEEGFNGVQDDEGVIEGVVDNGGKLLAEGFDGLCCAKMAE